MRICYVCERCGNIIDVIDVESEEQDKFEMDCLTGNDLQDIIKIDTMSDIMYVVSMCSDCITLIGLINGQSEECKPTPKFFSR